MAVFAGSDLKKWRESQGMSAADLAERISCDTTTLYRYESGKLKPNPDVMFQICEALGDIDRWTSWMRTEYPTSYGRMHPETAVFSLPGALMSMYAEIADVMELERETMRDGADGVISNTALEAKIRKEVTDMIQSAQRVRSLISARNSES
jgi:transcriptional regulator with XRE-family HTH domain